MVRRLFHLTKHIILLHEVDDEIAKIKRRIEEIYDHHNKYNIREGESTVEEVAASVMESVRERRRDVEEKDVVGLVHDSAQVIQQLTKSDRHRAVVSIIGMGGLGKTTLARKIYNHREVNELFPTHAWGYVSDDYRPRELWLSLLNCFLSKLKYDDLFKRKQNGDEADATREEKLKSKVGECLKGKKYLLVLDDIWKTEDWKKIEDAFPDEKNGKDCPSHLEPHGRSIVKICKGLPLAIVVLAGLVAKKEKSEREWLRINDITWHITGDKIEVMDILKLSYHSLPQRLKPCFLYFGIYPEDYEICAKELVRLWIAEGFIQPQEGAEPEDIAEYYLDELVDRSLVQVASRRSLDRGVKTCRIHDLLRDLCILESESDQFLVVRTNPINIHTPTNANPRRLSFHCNNCPKNVLKRFNLARVLYSKCRTPIKYRPLIDWKMMIHLRYLRIEHVDLPASVGTLWNLETLDQSYQNHRGKIKANLQTLWLTSADNEGIVSLLRNDIFPRLTKFVLYSTSYSSFGKQLPFLWLNHLSNLHSLKIIDALQLDANLFPSNITKITLGETLGSNINLSMNIKTLAHFANLQSLKLIMYYTSAFDLHISAGEFPKLRVFHMKLMKVVRWTLEKGAMPCLQNLLIMDCEHLSELPEQLWSLTTLQTVHVLKPNKEFADYLKNVELKPHCKLILS
ncbi:hypothetical protein VNO77_19727 [Canavalia gladiata]|uniref:NB-ARC domain-containing protein n=1 Tax=Canavalia gladiata TaxID=3824 RepID=A0AAN9LRG1_CANGL